MTAPHDEHFLFEAPIVRGTIVGAIIGVAIVIVGFALFVALADVDSTVMGAVGLVGPFSGAGFGAMVGGVMGALKVSAAEAEAEAQARQR